MRNGDRLMVYEYRAWDGYLIQAILPGAHRITATLGESSNNVLSRMPDACDVFMFHVDLTLSARVPFGRDALVNELRTRGITVWNAGILDISKRAVQRACVRAGVASVAAPVDGDPDEFVLVKTNYNYHGIPEGELTVRQRRMLGYESPHDLPSRAETDYRVVRRREVPAAIWVSPHWTVERYITNSTHRFYRAYLAGHAMVVSRAFDLSTVKKMSTGAGRENFFLKTAEAGHPPAAPAEIESVAKITTRVARAAQMEYGAFDFVSDDHGRLYLIDINKTPNWEEEGYPDLLAYLGTGFARAPHGK
jgi:hypothetical protein